MAWQPSDPDKFIEMCNNEASYVELALAFDTTYDKVKHYKSHIKKIGVITDTPTNLASASEVVVERTGSGLDSTIQVLTRKEVTSLEELIEVCAIDIVVWDIVSWKCKAYQGYIKDANEQIQKTQLFSVSASMRKKVASSILKDELAFLVEEAKKQMPVKVPTYERPRTTQKGHLLVVNPTDLHMGKYAWHKECGYNYDTDIAENLLREAIEDLMTKVAPYQVDQIVLTLGSDLLNADNSENMTTGGTPQTTDGRQQRTVRKTWMLMRAVIEQLRVLAPVHIVVVNGNHDRDTSFAIGEIISVAFENYKDVTIDNTPPSRKYVEYGKCLIMFTHGDTIKLKDIPNIMAEEAAEAWGRTLWRCAETGHLHDQAVMEFPGCVVRRNPALTAPEDWHASKGFVGKIRTVHAHLWDADDGNIAQFASSPIRPARVTPVMLGQNF